MVLQLANILEKDSKLEMILNLPYCDDTFSAIVAEINVDEDKEALKKFLILQMIVILLILKLHLDWE